MANTHPFLAGRTAVAALLPGPSRWRQAGALALLLSGVAMAAMPRATAAASSQEFQWQALAIAPLSAGARTGLRLVATPAVEPIDLAPDRPTVELAMTFGAGDSMRALLARAGATYADAGNASAMIAAAAPPIAPGTPVSVVLGRKTGTSRPVERIALRAGLGLNLAIARAGNGALQLIKQPIPVDNRPLRVRGRAGDGLYWSLRAAGVSPQAAAEYLHALATEIDVGSDIGADDRFDLVIASRRAATGERQTGPLLYAGIDRAGARDLELIKWASGGNATWIDAANIGHPSAAAMLWPVHAPITSGFGLRYHPILHFTRMHKGIDFGAAWGSPIVAAADGQIAAAGFAGGYGRQVQIAHAGGILTSYSHMSSIVAAAGSFVRQGQLIGYVGSSGLSTGPHLHYEVHQSGVAVNPLSVRFAGTTVADSGTVNAIKARLKALLSVGMKG
ncbi:M23 family metallopeptidase [Sphingomonas sp.]|uniref:M23 family metallopeptidase n=1 Tax=Sphingomonas sp. TaxID=28214 RepID=UPI00286AA65E|nr:M23 family metallopeptidase [Sphingomonas sp.]